MLIRSTIFSYQKNIPFPNCRLLDSVLDKALPFVHVAEVSNFDVEQAVAELRQALVDIHTCLEEYRYHEGREVLVNQMKSQLDSIKDLERDLERFVFLCCSLCVFKFLLSSFVNFIQLLIKERSIAEEQSSMTILLR